MLDQTPTIKGFRRIILNENRKGNYIVGKYMQNVLHYDSCINKELKYRWIQADRNPLEKETRIRRSDQILEDIRNKRNAEIDQELKKIIDKINSKNFKPTLKKKDIQNGKPIYVLEDKPEVFFAMKHLQYCLGRLFKVKQSDRYEITSQLAIILDDGIEKFIYRTDVADFYESIPEKAFKYILKENLLSKKNKQLLRHIMEQYYSKIGSRRGVPRGIGLSAYLAEIYMRQFDRQVSMMKDLVFYRRYVDDMIFVFVPSSHKNMATYVGHIDKLFEEYELQKNKEKSRACELKYYPNKTSYKFDYLGYNFYYKKSLSICLSSKKFSKIIARMDAAIAEYNASKARNKRKADRLLCRRIKYLTSNTKLHNRKSKVLVGIFFSNPLVNNDAKLQQLDMELEKRLKNLNFTEAQKPFFANLSFKSGFESKKITLLSPEDLKEVCRCWKGIK